MHSFTVVTSVFLIGDGVSKVMQAAVPSITMWYTIRIMTTPLDELRLQLKTSATSSFDFGCGDKQWLLWLFKTGIFFSGWSYPCLCAYIWQESVMAVKAITHWSNWKSNKTEDYWTVWSIRSGTHTDTHSRATSKGKKKSTTKFTQEGKIYFSCDYNSFVCDYYNFSLLDRMLHKTR